MGGIWIRPDHTGNLKIRLNNCLSIIWSSFKIKEFWTEPAMWLSNLPFLIIVVISWKKLTEFGWKTIFNL